MKRRRIRLHDLSSDLPKQRRAKVAKQREEVPQPWEQEPLDIERQWDEDFDPDGFDVLRARYEFDEAFEVMCGLTPAQQHVLAMQFLNRRDPMHTLIDLLFRLIAECERHGLGKLYARLLIGALVAHDDRLKDKFAARCRAHGVEF